MYQQKSQCKKKTIWVINQFAGTHESGWGERHFFFSKYWLEAGYNVTIISGTYNHMFSKLPDAPSQFNFEYVEKRIFCWVKTPHYKPNSIARFWSFWVFAWKILFIPIEKAGKPDIIIVSSMPIFPILTAYFLKKRYKAQKLLFEIRDIWPLSLIELGKYSSKHPAVLFIGWFERFGYKKADNIITLLPNASAHFEKIAKGSSLKTIYIPNGLDGNALLMEPVPEEIDRRIPEQKFIVGYSGSIGMANALEHFIEAARLLKYNENIYFVLIGEGYLKKEIIKKAEGLQNLSFFSKVRKSQVISVISLFDLCFIGWRSRDIYNFGVSANKYFDYMYAGKPILDSNNMVGSPVELSGCGLIVKPESAEAIAEGIIQFYNMPREKREEMGARGREYVKKYHNIAYLAQKYQSVFEN